MKEVSLLSSKRDNSPSWIWSDSVDIDSSLQPDSIVPTLLETISDPNGGDSFDRLPHY